MYRPSFKSGMAVALGLTIGMVATQTVSAQGYRRQMPKAPAGRPASSRPTPSQPTPMGAHGPTMQPTSMGAHGPTMLPTFQSGYLGGMGGMGPGGIYYPPVPPIPAPFPTGMGSPLTPPIGLDDPMGTVDGPQDPSDPSMSSPGGTGAGDDAGSYLQGAADVIRSQGEYLVSAGQAGLIGEQTSKAKIDNRRLALDQWLYEREMTARVREQDEYRQAAARQMRAAEARTLQTARAENKAPLTWPLPLLRPDFKASRERFATAVSRVSGKNSGRMDWESYKALSGAVEDLRADVKNHINDMTPGQYLESKRFVTRLGDAVEGMRVAAGRQVRAAE